MNKYVVWGDVSNTINNPEQYVFISGFGEFFGMFIFILLLVSVCLNFNLTHSKGYMKKAFGWVVVGICLALVMGLFGSLGIQMGLFKMIDDTLPNNTMYNLTSLSLNPALIIAYMLKGANWSITNFYIPVGNGFIYLIMQFLGAFIGSLVAYLFFKHLIANQEQPWKLKGCFYTQPSIKDYKWNYFCEFVSTFVLTAMIICFNYIFNSNQLIPKILVIGLLVGSIGYGLGGTTGYALNPFRDLGPRITYYIFLSTKKGACKEDWKYAQVPILGPILGAIVATLILPGFLYL